VPEASHCLVYRREGRKRYRIVQIRKSQDSSNYSFNYPYSYLNCPPKNSSNGNTMSGVVGIEKSISTFAERLRGIVIRCVPSLRQLIQLIACSKLRLEVGQLVWALR
jgi:hypothetical protein